MTSKSQESAQSKFSWTCLILQIAFLVIFFLLVRYDDSADAKHIENRTGHNHKMEENIAKYPFALDIHMMLFGGFGFLMTFLRRYGYSSVAFTMMITAMVTEWAILLIGFTKLDGNYVIHLDFMHILEGGLCAAAVLISFGAVLGKLNPFQLLVMALIEASLFVANSYLGYSVFGVLDVGGAIFIHAFGAYFGLAVSFMARKRNVGRSDHLEGARYSSDLFAMVGTILLWVFWPSFNAILADDDAFHRAIINTYLSLLGSTVATFTISSLVGEKRRFDMVDIQNATLSGGVAVGAVADLMLQPYGAFMAGTCVGAISTLGFRKVQSYLHDKLKLHDTCGVHYLHGIPGVISGLLSVLMCILASEDIYGPSLYLLFPRCAPDSETDSDRLTELQTQLPQIESGEGRSLGMQAVYQVVALGITLVAAIVVGLITGLVLSIPSVFHPLSDYQLFDDIFYWELPADDAPEGKRSSDEFEGLELKREGGATKKSQVDPEVAQGLM